MMPPAASLLSLKWSGLRVEVTSAHFGPAPFARHFHDGFAIGLVTSGVNRFRHGSRVAEAAAGSVCVVNAGEVHDGGTAGVPWSYANLLIPAPLIRSIAAELGVTPEFEVPHIALPASVAAMRAFFVQALDGKTSTEGISQAGLSALDALLSSHAVRQCRPMPQHESELASRARELIEDTWDRNIPLAEIADLLGASRFRVIRAVYKACGLTPHQLQLQVRVERARRKILAGEGIADVAAGCGFADQAHLGREMKRRWGLSPGAIRRAAR